MSKINPADAETERCLEIQRAAAFRTGFSDRLFVFVCLSLLLALGILIWVLPHPAFSPDENRVLSQFPEFSLEALTDGTFTSDIGSFFSDQFPLRKYFVGLKAVSELAQLKMQNNSVIPSKGGSLIKRLEYDDYSIALKNLSAVDDFQIVLSGLGIPVTVAFAPRSIDVLASELPPLYGSDRSEGIWTAIENSGINNVDLRAALTSMAADGQYVWYKTDHHWTTLGAYEAYSLLAPSLGYTAKSISYFTVEQATDKFYGTTYSSSGMRWTAPDAICYFRFSGDEYFTVENMLTGEILKGFYKLSYLESKDKYSSFIGGNSAYVRIVATDSSAAANKPTLLVIKDSYANSVAPFLAIHFNLEIIDLRYYNGSAAALAKNSGADAVLILIGADSLAISDDLTSLRRGLSSFDQ